MDSIIPRHPNNPDYEGADNPTAQDVVDSILNKDSEYDFTEWKAFTDADHAECFRDIVGIYANYWYNSELGMLENRALLLAEIREYIEAVLINAARHEGYLP